MYEIEPNQPLEVTALAVARSGITPLFDSMNTHSFNFRKQMKLINYYCKTGAVFLVLFCVTQPITASLKVQKQVAPEYPAEARRFNLEGTVHLKLLVDDSGRTKNVMVVGNPPPILAESAIKALKQWRFNRQERDTIANIPVPFGIRDTGEYACDTRNRKPINVGISESLEGKKFIYENTEIRILIDKTGKVSDSLVVRWTDPEFARDVRNEMKSWVFGPSTEGGKDTAMNIFLFRSDLSGKITIERTKLETLYNNGIKYYKGEDVPQDYQIAVKWLTKAAEFGSPEARYQLSMMYLMGDCVEQNHEEAFKWLSLAAKLRHAQAQGILGLMYFNGEGVKQDYKKAKELLMESVRQGIQTGQFELGFMYNYGYGVKKDERQAVWWYRRAAEQGDDKAQYYLGKMYANGDGVRQDYEEALRWYMKAAEQGNDSAQFYLGIHYFKGIEVEQDNEEAFNWSYKAAEQGNAGAQQNLGFMYDRGKGVEQNHTEAVKWFTKAAEQGHLMAQHSLAIKYYNGEGVEKNDAVAINWFRKSAEQGYAMAQFRLGMGYLKGDGVPQDYIQAYKWLSLAAKSDHKNAKKQIDLVADLMTKDQIAEAKKLEREWSKNFSRKKVNQ